MSVIELESNLWHSFFKLLDIGYIIAKIIVVVLSSIELHIFAKSVPMSLLKQ